MNKRGNMILAGAIILAMVFSLIYLVFILKANVLDPFNDDIQADSDYGTTSKTISSQTSGNYSSQWDFIIVIIFITSWIASMLLARDLDTNAVYFAIALIIMSVVVMVAMNLEDVYDDTLTDTDYVGMELKFPLTHWLMSNIVPLIIIVMVSIGVVLYAKP